MLPMRSGCGSFVWLNHAHYTLCVMPITRASRGANFLEMTLCPQLYRMK